MVCLNLSPSVCDLWGSASPGGTDAAAAISAVESMKFGITEKPML